MEVADSIVLLNGGRVEQSGAPRDLYDRPASDFVMGFLGPVSRVAGGLVRPHDVTVHLEPDGGAVEAQVLRVIHLGFEVRVELQLHDGAPFTVQLARHEAEAFELHAGQIVYIKPPEPALFAGAGI